MLRKPPHVLVTTPESLYLMLTAGHSRDRLRHVRTVIVDEIHAVIGTRRGAHLALTLERLAHVSAHPVQRIGLSATQRPVEDVARFLVGSANVGADGCADCVVVDEGHRRATDLALELPGSPLEAVMSHEVWEEYYDRLAALIARASDDAGVRQHAQDGRAPGAAPLRSRRRGRRRRASRQPGEGAPPRRRAAAEARRAEGARRDRVARARHRHRPRRPGVPGRLAAPHRDVPAARRPRRAHHCRHAQGPPAAAVARRPGRVRGAAPRRPRGRARSPDRLRRAARRAVAAARRGNRRRRVARGRSVRAGASRLAVPRPAARRLRRGRRHAGERLHHTPGPARRAGPPRRSPRTPARAPIRPADGAHLGRRHPRRRRLSRAARARRSADRHAQRGLRDREQCRRRVPAREQLVAHPPGRLGGGPRRRCARGAAHAAVLAGRGAGAQRGAVVLR